MAYDKKPIRVLAGGLVLVAPGDIINDDDSQELLNFTTDSQGALKSRRGHTIVCSVGGVKNQIRGIGGRYQNAPGTVYKQCGAVMAGVSGPTLVAWKDFVWSPPRKTDGTHDWRWIPEAPTAKPSIKAAVEVVTPIDAFTGGWTVDPTGSDTYDSTLRIQPTGVSVFSAQKAFGADLYNGFDKDDIFRIRLKAKWWEVINGVTFAVDVNEGDFKKDYYSAVMGLKNLSAAKKEEITFYIRKRPLPVDDAAKDKNRYGAFTRIGSTPDKDWRSVTTLRVTVDFNDGTKFWFENWEMVGDTDNTLEGDDFQGCYTYTTDAGHESNPSPFSDPIEVNHSGIIAFGLVPSTDPQVTGMRIYLTGGTLQGVYSVTGPPISPQVTTYNIRAKDDDLTGFNIQLENDHQDPPAATWGLGPYFDRIILFKGNRYYWSHQNKPYAFALPDDNTGGDWGQLEQSLGDILSATMRPGQIWIHCQNGVAIMEGDPGGPASSVQRASTQMGISSQQGVVQAPEGDYCNFAEGIYLFNGGSAQEISRKIQTVFKGSWDASKAAMGFRNSIVWASDGNRTFKWDVGQDRWFEDSRKFTSFYWDGGTLLGATVGGQLVALETGFTDDGSPIPVAWTSKYYDAGILDNEKTWEDVTIWADTAGASLTVTALMENGASSVALGTISSIGKTRFVLQMNGSLGVKARNCALRVTGSVSGQCVLYEVALNYYVEAREAKSFDSDERDDGTYKMKELMEVQVDLHSPSAAQLIIQSDQPGFEMGTRDDSHAFGASTTRRADMYVLPTSVLAHNYRMLLNGPDFRLYGMRVRGQVIGTLLHGSKAEFYRSDPVAPGGERVCLFKEIHVKYASTGSVLIEAATELPGGSIQFIECFPATLPATGGIRFINLETAKIRLRGTAKGRVIWVRLTPTDDLRLEDLEVNHKAIGLPNATPWGFVPFPLEQTQPAIWRDVFIQPDSPA